MVSKLLPYLAEYPCNDADTAMKLPNSSTRLGRVIRLPLRLVPRNAVVKVRGGINRGMRWRVGSSVHGCWLGVYEPEKQSTIRNLAKEGMNAFDIGANAGFYTLGLASVVRHVWAFEPFAVNVQNLTNHLSLNGLTNVTVVQAAVADEVGMRHFRVHSSNSMGKLSSEPTNLLVPAITLDGLVASGVPIPDLVKMDIEGGELAALRGASRLVAARRTTWLVALDDPKTADECVQILTSAGYSIRSLGPPGEIVATP